MFIYICIYILVILYILVTHWLIGGGLGGVFAPSAEIFSPGKLLVHSISCVLAMCLLKQTEREVQSKCRGKKKRRGFVLGYSNTFFLLLCIP